MKITIYTKEKGIIETTIPLTDEIKTLTWHRDDGPAYIVYYENGNIHRELYWVDGKRYRSDGPADIEYYENGNIHRELYWVDDKIHRTDGPAIIEYYKNGTVRWEEYRVDDKRHRTDGPAYIEYYEDGTIKREEYCINGVNITNHVKQWRTQKNITFPLTDKEQYEFMLRFS